MTQVNQMLTDYRLQPSPLDGGYPAGHSHTKAVNDWAAKNARRDQIKAAMVEDLRNGVVEFAFTKVNGDIRQMKATLNQKEIPQEVLDSLRKVSEAVQDRPDSPDQRPDLIVAFDVESKGWRSFKVESVQWWKIR